MNSPMQNLPYQAALDQALSQLIDVDRARYHRFWSYYRNQVDLRAALYNPGPAEHPYRQAQEWGLPPRLLGNDGLHNRKNIVIENDIRWRIDASVDYLFSRSPVLLSTACDPARRAALTTLLNHILAVNGGVLFLQRLALLGAVYGFVDVLVKFQANPGAPEAPFAQSDDPTGGSSPALPPPARSASPVLPAASQSDPVAAPGSMNCQNDPGVNCSHEEALLPLARRIHLEIVEPTRAVPVFCPTDSGRLLAYGQCYDLPGQAAAARPSRWPRLRRAVAAEAAAPRRILDLIEPHRWQRLRDGATIQEGINPLGRIPLAHVQNLAVPFQFPGFSEVEPLIPLQDELNTRLSDRANRLALQSFKMYLGRGIDDFLSRPIEPGQMWSTDNPAAQVQEFGGDANSPSEQAHLDDLREAMDKTSGVSAIAAGVIKNRLGRLTSAAALRVTLMALLSRTERKRTTYGQGIEQICELALQWLDWSGLFPTRPDQRGIELHWPSPLPENDLEKLQEAEAKLRVGVPREDVLRELGY